MITVFTPTYNRAYILKDAYYSLINQTNKEFIWLIIDDGSSDNTEELVYEWIKEDKIKIKYIKQQNRGKHAAHNTAVKNCKTDYILILDSDDYLNKKAIEILNKEITKINDNEKISGIIGNKYKKNTHDCIGTKMPQNIDYTTGIELYQKLKFKGDTLRVYKTKILKDYLFPIIEGEKFIYENIVFDAIDEKYKMLINRDELYYCEYLEDGYTKNAFQIKVKNPKGYSLSLNSSIKHAIKFQKKINWTIIYILWCKMLKIEDSFQNFNNKFLYIFLYPIAQIFYIVKKPNFFFENFK